MVDQVEERAREILNRHCEYMDGLDRGQVMIRTSNALAAIRDALSTAYNPNERLTARDASVDSGMDGDAVTRAEWAWANLPTGRPWTSLTTAEKALVCHTLAWLDSPNERLREALEPVNTCEMPEVAAMRYINQLRADEGDGVMILCDNPEPNGTEDQVAIDCIGQWTNWKDRRFYGESVLQCLAKAVEARAALARTSPSGLRE